MGEVPEGYYTVPLESAAVFRPGDDADRAHLRHDGVRVARRPRDETGIDAEIIDLRSLWPLDLDDDRRLGEEDRPLRRRARGDAHQRLRRRAVGAGAGALLLSPRGADRARHRLGHAVSARAGVGVLPGPGPRRRGAASARWRPDRWAFTSSRCRTSAKASPRSNSSRGTSKPGDTVVEDQVAGRRDDRQGDGRDSVAGRRQGASRSAARSGRCWRSARS